IVTGQPVGVLALSPDGRRLATVGLIEHSSPSGSMHSITSDDQVRIWDVPKGEELPLHIRPGRVSAVAFTPDGRTLLTNGGTSLPVVKQWDMAAGRLVREWPPLGGDMFGLVVSPDGDTLATGGQAGVVRLWDLATGLERRPAEGHVTAIAHLAFGPD